MMKNDSDGVDVVVASAFVIDRLANAMPFGGITIWMHESRERERERVDFLLTYSVFGTRTACHLSLIRMQRYSERRKVQYVRRSVERAAVCGVTLQQNNKQLM